MRKIVCCLDDSPGSTFALHWLLDNLLDPKRDQLYLLSVGIFSDALGDLLQSIGQGKERLAELEDKARAYAKAILDKATHVLGEHHISKETQVSHEIYALKGGDARKVICEFCEEQKVDILVMGSRGLGSLEKAVLGSVTEYCVSHAPCPTIVVRPPN